MSAEKQLRVFMAKYTPEVVAVAESALAKMRARLPGAVELVYDSYNALVVGFGPTERASDAIFSIALYPRWVNLYFLRGASLSDPEGRLQGSGSRVRHILLESAATLDEPAVITLMAHALEASHPPLDAAAPRRIVIMAVSAKQRPRRPRRTREANGAGRDARARGNGRRARGARESPGRPTRPGPSRRRHAQGRAR
jgi:hypothetical protein